MSVLIISQGISLYTLSTLATTFFKDPKIDIDSNSFPLSLDACLRVAASAKAGERACPVEYV
jgi:hypothetical protein